MNLQKLWFKLYRDNFFVHYSEEVVFNSKNNTLYDFCEVEGIGESIVKVKNLEELKEIIDNVLML